MTFVYHHRTAGRGAEGNHIVSLVHALEAAAHSVTIISPPGIDPRCTAGAVPLDKGASKQRGLQRLWQWVSCHCPAVLFEFAEVTYNLYAFCRLLPVLWRHRLTAVYYERYAFFSVAGVMLARVFRIPVILEVNEVAGLQRARKQILTRLSRWFEGLVLRCADRVITVSTFLNTEVVQRGAPARSVYTMPNAIHPERFNVVGRGDAVRQQYALEDAIVLGFVGWFDDWDRLDLLIDAVHQLHVNYPQIRLLLVGDGPVMTRLKAQVEEYQLNSCVIFAGPVDRHSVPIYIDAMDICVLPDSNPYGSPMALIEFMAMGKPVIAPDLLPIRDVIRDGENGQIIERNNLSQLQGAIIELASNAALRSRLGTQARQDMLTQRTWSANAKAVALLAQDITKDDRR